MKAKLTIAVGAVVCSAWMLGADVALAGEVNGKGDPIPGGDTGRSACSFSGLQDEPEVDHGFFRGDRVQSWGQIPRLDEDSELGIGRESLTLGGSHPGTACNPNRSQGEP